MIKNPPECRRHGFNLWFGKIPWRRVWQPTSVFLPGESPWTEKPGEPRYMGLPRVRHDWATKHSTAHMGYIEDCIKKRICGVLLTFGRVVVHSLSLVRLFVIPWTGAYQAFLSFTISQSLLKLLSVESVMLSNHLILCLPLLFLPSIFPSVRVFSNELALWINSGLIPKKKKKRKKERKKERKLTTLGAPGSEWKEKKNLKGGH